MRTVWKKKSRSGYCVRCAEQEKKEKKSRRGTGRGCLVVPYSPSSYELSRRASRFLTCLSHFFALICIKSKYLSHHSPPPLSTSPLRLYLPKFVTKIIDMFQSPIQSTQRHQFVHPKHILVIHVVFKLINSIKK